MAVLGRWTGSPALFPTTSWAAPNGLFPTQARNDTSAYTFTSSTSTLTLPSSDLADGYLLIARVHIDCSHNNRNTNQDRILQTGGTGNFANLQAGSYERNNNNDENYSLCMAFVDNPSASSTFQYSWRREVGDGTPAGAVTRASFDVIPLYYSDVGIYTSTTAELLGGTTPNAASIATTTLEGANITRSGTTVSVTGDNKRYMVLGSHYAEGRGGRTQRWVGPIYDSTLKRSATSYQYWRDAGTDNLGVCFTDIMETVTATRTIQLGVYRGDGIANNQGGADSDGSTPSAALNTLVVIELNDSAEVFKTEDGTGGQDLIAATVTDLNISRTTDIEFNDSASWTRASDTALNAEVAMDALVGATAGGAYNAVSSGTRATGRCDLTVNGTEDADVYHGGYGRGAQSSTDTFGYSANPVGFVALSSGDDVGFSVVNEGDQGPVDSQAGWVGAWGINLDTLEASGQAATGTASVSGGGSITGTATRTEAHTGTASISAGGSITVSRNADFPRRFDSPETGSPTKYIFDLSGELDATQAETGTASISGAGTVSASREKGGLGSLTIGAGGSITGTATRTEAHTGTASISAGGTVTAAREKGSLGSLTISAGGAITSTATRSEAHTGTATVTAGLGITVTGSATEAHTGTASVTGAGTVTAAREKGSLGSLTISAGGVITGTATRTEAHTGTATVTAGLGITVTGSADEAHTGTASVTGGGTVTAAREKGGLGSTLNTVGGTVAVTREKGGISSPTVTGGGSITGTATRTEAHTGTATVTAGLGITATGTADEAHTGTATVTGGGTVVVAREKGGLSSPSISAGGAISGTATRSEAHTGTATVTAGLGITVTGSADEAHTGTASVTGGGAVTATGTASQVATGTASVSGGGSIAATGAHAGGNVVSITGGGAISAETSGAHSQAASVSGGGQIAVTYDKVVLGGNTLRVVSVLVDSRERDMIAPSRQLRMVKPKTGQR